MNLLPTAILGAIKDEFAVLIAETAAVQGILNALNIFVIGETSQLNPVFYSLIRLPIIYNC